METRKQKKSPVITPPRWKLFVAMTMLCFLFFESWSDSVVNPKSLSSLITTLVEMLLIISTVITSGIHYKFTNDRLVVCFLWIPIRHIRWQRISHALFAHAWADPKTRYQRIGNPGAVTGQIIYVSIDNCPRWYPILTMRGVHNLVHPFRAFTIWLPYDRKDYFIDAFKQHYPDLEMQPLDAWTRF